MPTPNYTKQGAKKPIKESPHQRKLVCEQCGREFRLLCRLREHSTQATCDICDRHFKRRAEMRRHRQVVHEHGLYACSYCYCFTNKRKDNVEAHMKKKHGWERRLDLMDTESTDSVDVSSELDPERGPIPFDSAEEYDDWLQRTRQSTRAANLNTPRSHAATFQMAEPSGPASTKSGHNVDSGLSMNTVPVERSQPHPRTVRSPRYPTASTGVLVQHAGTWLPGNATYSRPSPAEYGSTHPARHLDMNFGSGPTRDYFNPVELAFDGDLTESLMENLHSLDREFFQLTRYSILSWRIPPSVMIEFIRLVPKYFRTVTGDGQATYIVDNPVPVFDPQPQSQSHFNFGQPLNATQAQPPMHTNSTYESPTHVPTDFSLAGTDECDDVSMPLAGTYPSTDSLVGHTYSMSASDEYDLYGDD